MASRERAATPRSGGRTGGAASPRLTVGAPAPSLTPVARTVSTYWKAPLLNLVDRHDGALEVAVGIERRPGPAARSGSRVAAIASRTLARVTGRPRLTTRPTASAMTVTAVYAVRE